MFQNLLWRFDYLWVIMVTCFYRNLKSNQPLSFCSTFVHVLKSFFYEHSWDFQPSTVSHVTPTYEFDIIFFARRLWYMLSINFITSTRSQEEDWKDSFLWFEKHPSKRNVEMHEDKTDLVQALHHHVGHVLVQHGRRYDDFVEPLVVSPQSCVGGLFLSAPREGKIQPAKWTKYRFSENTKTDKEGLC